MINTLTKDVSINFMFKKQYEKKFRIQIDLITALTLNIS